MDLFNHRCKSPKSLEPSPNYSPYLHRHLWSRFRPKGRTRASLSSSLSSGFSAFDGICSPKGLPLHLELSSAMSAPQPLYVIPSGNYAETFQPPPYSRNIPRYESSNQKRKGNCCLRCICCCYCFLFIFILISLGILLYFYFVIQPEMPSYQVVGMEVKAFNFQMDFSLNTQFLVTVKAENPNKNIGFVYGEDSSVTVSYTDSTLCSGKLPAFHQGHENITMMKVDLKGKSEFGSGLQEALMKSKNNGKIPLLVSVQAPVNIVMGKIKTRQFVVHVNCSLVVDNLSPNKKIGILSSKYTVEITA